MFDLNGKDFQESIIFNNGKAGLAPNCTISVVKRGPSEPESNSPYKLIVKDENGGLLTGWFNYPTDREGYSTEQNIKAAKREISRVLHIARAVVGSDYTFPDTTGMSPSQIVDALFKIVEDNCEGHKFNVFATYGTKDYPNKKGYLNLRYFNFIEKAVTGVPTRLTVGAQDLMERVVADEDTPNTEMTELTSVTSTTDWTKL